jgi:hypothetical protein
MERLGSKLNLSVSERAMEYRQASNLRISYRAVIQDFHDEQTKVPKSLRRKFKRLKRWLKVLEVKL